jgi:prephenate dehydrogenase
LIERVVIVGTGLIGGSIGLALRAGGFTGSMVGIDSSEAELARAVAMGAVDSVGNDAALLGADLIVLAVPVMGILDWMHRLGPLLGPHQMVTDVGSTKHRIAAVAAGLFQGEG